MKDKLENKITPFYINEKEIEMSGEKAFLLKEIASFDGRTRKVLYNTKGLVVQETMFNGDHYQYDRKQGNLLIEHYSAACKKTNCYTFKDVMKEKQYSWC